MHLDLPGIPAALEHLFASSWQAGLLVLLVVSVQTLLRRQLTMAWRHAMWWIVLGRLLILVPPASPWSLFNFLPKAGDPGQPAVGFSLNILGWHSKVALSPQGLAETPSKMPRESGHRGTHDAHQAVTATGHRENPGLEPRSTLPSETAVLTLGSTLTGIWAIGVLFMLGRLLLHNLRFARRIRAGMLPAGPSLGARLEACRVRMRVRRSVELLEGDVIPSPAVYGLLRTRLLLPRRLAEIGSPETLDHIFLHELAHIRRGDLWVHGLTRVLRALHWFNPILAWGFRRLRLDRELATDALALQVAGPAQSRAYGLTILELLENWSRRAAQPGTIGILEDNASLERRIRAIAQFRPASRWAPLSAILIAALAAASWTGAQPPVNESSNEGNSDRSFPPVVLESNRAADLVDIPWIGRPADREERQAIGRKLLVEAIAAQQNDQLAVAAKAFDASVGALSELGTNAPPELLLAIEGVRSSRLELARRALDKGRLNEANAHLDRVLQLAPQDPAALALFQTVRERLVGRVIDDANRTGRKKIQALLESIRLSEVGFDRIPLEVAVRQLKEMAYAGDPAGKGVNIIINPSLDISRAPEATINPNTGEAVSPQVVAPVPLGDVIIRIHPPLHDVRLVDVLKALTASAETPIQFSIEDYAVVFMYQPPRHLRMVTRMFRVNPKRFERALESTKSIRETNAPPSHGTPAASPVFQVRVREFVKNLGVSLLPPNAVFFNDRLGWLMVRSTREEIQIIKDAIEALNDGTEPIWRNSPTDSISPPDKGSPTGAGNVGNVELLNQYAQAIAKLDDLLTRLQVQEDSRVPVRELVEALDLVKKAGFTNVSVAPIPISSDEPVP